MNRIEEDPIIGQYFDTAEKKAKWIVRFKILYLLWLAFIIIGITFLIYWWLQK